jgi:CheY-like chemotaxis protein
MSKQDLDLLRHEMDADVSGANSQVRREFMRWPFDRLVKCEIAHSAGNTLTLVMACRNISRGGISLLHRAFVYPGTKVSCTLPHPLKGTVIMTGAIKRCRHHRGTVHELGIRFDKPCNVRELLGLGQADRCYLLERVDPEKLSGTVLLIEDSEMDRLVVRQALADTSMSVVAAESGEAGLERSSQGFDVILCSMDLPDMTWVELMEKLRDRGVHAPFVLISADNTQAIRDAVRSARPDGFIARPLGREALLSVLGEVMLLPGEDAAGGAPMFSSLTPESPMIAHVPAYLDELKKYAERLREAVGKGDATTARRLAFQIKGSAPTFGFESLARVADAACKQLTASVSVEESSESLKSLIAGCLRARGTRASPKPTAA